MSERDVYVAAAADLLIAAITMRDLLDAMPPSVRTAMPADIKGRVDRHTYQTSFDALPADIRAEATAIVDADADIIAARQL
ncbi:hypothetical protein [Streptomyces sp. A1547]|uniref:hypothetical protein n=1 Tax=Streptomyces sp. A1547 TaxID=2563105 RepID=UPI00109E73F7|nr:hypothetical protein [Streptomyces sp. A1547]THA38146.1 hypothetical protein E6W17_16825 [Streptomyces sp. A1547]